MAETSWPTPRPFLKNVKDAFARSGSVERLVLLSSSGAQFRQGVGEIKTNNAAERILTDTNVPTVIFVRCAYFMENWTANLDPLRSPQPFFYSTVTPLDWKMPMLMGRTMPAMKPHIFELHGPRLYSLLDVQQAFCTALGKQISIKPVERADLDAFFSRIFPPQIVGEWVEMATCFLPGGVVAADSISYDDVSVQRGTTELVDAITSAVDVGFERV
ncbi:NAD-dependent epimerase/dehydratase [Ophiocordyceps camponoti-floridani]|uniref:NAD-dependent epimerase/dehydratase n=1 Tax=Ophiocordyceps camponoti-floridani TaxID=2030778 RepID=A0A8H4QCK1_9HYPO|nr:NAD-dependent epimerase/dehydratase [Ophiocordyceps camponoti-floridani]